MGYLVRKFDKKEFWSAQAGRFINPYMKFSLTIFDTLEEAKIFALNNTKSEKKPLLICDIDGKIIK